MQKSNNRNTRNIRNTRKTKKRRVIYKRDLSRKNLKTKGGNALASGGYGCIFSPALKCANSKHGTGMQQVSKLMLTDYAELEYNEAKNLKKILSLMKSTMKIILWIVMNCLHWNLTLILIIML